MRLYTDIAASTNKVHHQLDSQPYLARYETTDITLTDRYRHLIQLQPIYIAIESKLKELDFTKNIPEEFQYLTERTKVLTNDIDFMKSEPKLKFTQDNTILPTTLAYIEQINALKNSDIDKAHLFGHFLVRILGDLHGGQSTKKHVHTLYQRQGFIPLDDEIGIQFYTFKDGTLAKLIKWLNNDTFDNQPEILAGAMNAFISHIPIFEELEKTRKVISINQPASFFATHQRKLEAVVVATTAVVAGILWMQN